MKAIFFRRDYRHVLPAIHEQAFVENPGDIGMYMRDDSSGSLNTRLFLALLLIFCRSEETAGLELGAAERVSVSGGVHAGCLLERSTNAFRACRKDVSCEDRQGQTCRNRPRTLVVQLISPKRCSIENRSHRCNNRLFSFFLFRCIARDHCGIKVVGVGPLTFVSSGCYMLYRAHLVPRRIRYLRKSVRFHRNDFKLRPRGRGAVLEDQIVSKRIMKFSDYLLWK